MCAAGCQYSGASRTLYPQCSCTVWRANGGGNVENRQIRRRSQQIDVAAASALCKTNRMKRRLAWVPLCAMVLIGCNDAPPPPAATSAAAAPPFHTTLTTKQLMTWIIDPNAVAIWNSVGSVATDKGTEERHPKTDEEWASFRNTAAVLVESGNLLMLDGRAQSTRINGWPRHAAWPMRRPRCSSRRSEGRRSLFRCRRRAVRSVHRLPLQVFDSAQGVG